MNDIALSSLIGHAVLKENWLQLTSAAAFGPRDTAAVFSWNGRLWLSNGYVVGGSGGYRDLWRSGNGVTWTLVHGATPYPQYSFIAPFNGELWAISNEIWKSSNGAAWTQVSSVVPWASGSWYGALLVHGGKLRLITSVGGVWSSPDGTNWTEDLASAPFGSRGSFSAAVLGGKMIVVGGFKLVANVPPEVGYPGYTTLNDVWSSTDGITWDCETPEAPWSPRAWVGLCTHLDELYLHGGYDNINGANLGDTWASSDGRTWRKVVTSNYPSPRHFPSMLSHNGRLLCIAGNAWPTMNDVWALQQVAS